MPIEDTTSLNKEWNQSGVVTVPLSPSFRRQRREQENKQAKRARKSESPWAGYADAPSS
jgi:DNA replication protein DnaD